MNKSGFAVMAEEIDANGHKFGLIDLDDDGFKGEKWLYIVGFDNLVYFNDWVILDYEFDFFLLFLFDLNQVIVPDETKTLDNFVGLGREAAKDLFEDINELIIVNFFEFVGEFGKVQDDIIVKFFVFLDLKEWREESLFHGMGEDQEDFVGG